MKKNYEIPISTTTRLAFSLTVCAGESPWKGGPGDAFKPMPKRRTNPF